MNPSQRHSQRQSQRQNQRQGLSLLLVALMLTGVGVWMFCTGDLSDDLWYRHELEPNTTSQLKICGTDTITQDYAWCKGKPITEWRQVFVSCGRHYMHHGNGRLPNMLIYLENMIPSWVFDLMQVAMMAVMCVMMLRIGLPRWRYRPLATVLALWSLWIVLPWNDQMASTAYMLNYIWSSALNLWFLALMMGYCSSPPKRWALCLLGALAAVMHEGFSIPVAAGLLVLLLQTERAERKKLLVPIAVYCIFSLFVIFAPAAMARLSGASAVDKGPLFSLQAVYQLFVKSYMPAVTLCVMIWYAFRRGFKQLMRQLRQMLPLLTIAVVSLMMGIVLRDTNRTVWIAILMLLIICWRLLSVDTAKQRRWSSPLALLLGIALCAWLSYIGMLQYRAGEEMQQIAKEMKSTGSDLVYVNTVQRADLPWWTLDIPEYYHTAHPTVKGAHYAHLRQKEYFGLITLPEKFRGMPLDSLPLVAGNTGLKGEYPFYYSPKYLGSSVLAEFTLGSSAIDLLNGPVAPPYLIYAKIQDVRHGNEPIKHTYSLNAYPVVQLDAANDTVWFYMPDKFATSDLNRQILSVDIN